MRLLATGDDHFVERSRFAECCAVHSWMVDIARDLKIDAWADGGDVFDGESSVTEREAVAEWVTRMCEVAPGVMVRGNHDLPGEVAFMQRLRTKHPLIVEERAGVHIVGGAAVAAVAWPERAPILAMAGSIGATEEVIREALQAVFRGLGSELATRAGNELPRIGLMHGLVDGSIASSGQPLLGLPINIGLADLALFGADMGILSHIHKPQHFAPPSGGPWAYAGSSHRTDHSQGNERKVVLFAEFDKRRLVRLEEIETPCAPMTDLDATWSTEMGGALIMQSHPDLKGYEIRLRYKVAADQQDAAAAFAREWQDKMLEVGAKAVKLDPQVIVQTRARAPEVAAAPTFPQKLEAHWASLGFDPGERRSELLEMAAELEQEVHDAA